MNLCTLRGIEYGTVEGVVYEDEVLELEVGMVARESREGIVDVPPLIARIARVCHLMGGIP